MLGSKSVYLTKLCTILLCMQLMLVVTYLNTDDTCHAGRNADAKQGHTAT